jgi:hypothetical protein
MLLIKLKGKALFLYLSIDGFERHAGKFPRIL